VNNKDLQEANEDLRKRLKKFVTMYGKAQIELCRLRALLGEGSDSGLLKKARAWAPGPWIDLETLAPPVGVFVLARMRDGGRGVYLLRYVEPEGMERLGMWVDQGWHSFERPGGWLPIPE